MGGVGGRTVLFHLPRPEELEEDVEDDRRKGCCENLALRRQAKRERHRSCPRHHQQQVDAPLHRRGQSREVQSRMHCDDREQPRSRRETAVRAARAQA